MRYLPKSPADRKEMLAEIGVASIDDLFSTIPAEYQFKRDLAVPRQHGESEIIDRFRAFADQNAVGYASFLGAGVYRHYRPVLIDTVVSRGKFNELHAIPAGDRAGHPAGDVRVPDDDLRADRHGDRERVDV